MTTATAQTHALPDSADNAKLRQIIEAAKEVFTTDGFGTPSMDSIARKAGVSKATVYAHFDSKEQLFAAVIADECRKHSLLVPEEELDVTDPRATLRRIGHNFADLVFAPHVLRLYRIVVAESTRFPELGRIYYEMGPRTLFSWLAEGLRRADAAGCLVVPDPQLAAIQFLTMIRGEYYMRLLLGLTDRYPAPGVDELVDGAVEVFLKAYGRPDADASKPGA